MSPASRYRLLLRAYPRAHRAAHDEEMLAVLLATEERRGQWSVLPEAASLVMHGMALRIRHPIATRTALGSVGIAGVGLLLLLAVLGAHQLAAMGARGLGLDGYPESWQIGALWVDPRWPIQLTWLLTGIALLLGWHRMTVFLAWMAVLLHGWLAVGDLGSGLAPAWFGQVGPAWVAPFGAGQGGWLLLSCLAAAAAGGPGHLARALGSVRLRSCRRVLLAGIVGSSVALVAAPALSWLTAPEAGLTQCARGPLLALLAAGAFVLSALRRAVDGRQAVLLLALAALIPLTARWQGLNPLPINLVAGAGITAAYVLGIGRRDLAQDRQLQRSPE